MKPTDSKPTPEACSTASAGSAALPWQDVATRAGWWVVEIRHSKRLDIMEVRRHGRSGSLRYGRLTGEGWWHIAYMLDGRVAGPFKSRKRACAAMPQNGDYATEKPPRLA